MNPAACARAKKAARLEREAALAPPEPEQLPRTPEEAQAQQWRKYRKVTRPFRRAFAGIRTRRESERFLMSTARKQARIVREVTK